ncbi:hypothetical protein KFL_000090145 [Klebsormidium nitens]|uniref:Uncharacterized protein n=1 Tax=Klebsormidium nitens TaxID=105231 RepID=A0A1Y1HLY3_KLENI|nr:hypothetical protein KFL_000090145 [Klebsormidium nitens]|eukprot:GAQ78169.1 hypothetical protein KFL_000090145 [Klebsormidium nitens]
MAPKKKVSIRLPKRKKSAPNPLPTAPSPKALLDQLFEVILSDREHPSLTPFSNDDSPEEETKKDGVNEHLGRLFAFARTLRLDSSIGPGIPLGLSKEDVIAELDVRVASLLDPVKQFMVDQEDCVFAIRSGLGVPRAPYYLPKDKPQPAPVKESSPLARFDPHYAAGAAVGSEAAENVYQGRCDVYWDRCVPQCSTGASFDGGIIAINGGMGHRHGSPYMEVYNYAEDAPEIPSWEKGIFPKVYRADNGFWQPGLATSIDSTRNLLWCAGDERIKAFHVAKIDHDDLPCKYTLHMGSTANGVAAIDRLEEHGSDVSGRLLDDMDDEDEAELTPEQRTIVKDSGKHVDWSDNNCLASTTR